MSTSGGTGPCSGRQSSSGRTAVTPRGTAPTSTSRGRSTAPTASTWARSVRPATAASTASPTGSPDPPVAGVARSRPRGGEDRNAASLVPQPCGPRDQPVVQRRQAPDRPVGEGDPRLLQSQQGVAAEDTVVHDPGPGEGLRQGRPDAAGGCLLYTSDAADDLLCVDL